MDKTTQQIQKNWMIIFWIIILVLFIKFFPKIGYALTAITLLVLLLHYQQSKKNK
ncbi:MAG TPA: hypothetical protein VH815_10280 [Acidobacteriota bacterium]